MGEVNLSARRLTALPDEVLRVADPPKRLDISHNDFQQLTIPGSSPLLECYEVIADFNRFTKLNAFIQFTSLVRLDLVGNQISTLDTDLMFPLLTELNLSHNSLQLFSSRSFPTLQKLILERNELTELPDVINTKLQVLVLDGNRIHSLADIATKLPISLQELSICDNAIEDLCEVTFLSSLHELQAFSMNGNKCLDGKERAFNYRPYIYATLDTAEGSSLQKIDDEPLTETELIAGEEIFIGGRKCHFSPGNHEKLVDFLVKKCPIDAKKRTPKERQSLNRVLVKKRELDSSMASCGSPVSQISSTPINSPYSIHSPFSQWNRQRLENNVLSESKENMAPERNLAATTPRTPRTASSMSQVTPRFASSPSATTNRTVNSTRSQQERSMTARNDGFGGEMQTPRARRTRTAILLPNATQSEPFDDVTKSESIHKIKALIQQQANAIEELQQQVTNLTNINYALTENLETLRLQQQEMEAEMNAMQLKTTTTKVPIPEKLKLQNDGEGTVSVDWELRPIKGYNVIVDGQTVGTVRGWRNTAKVTELAPGLHTIQMAAVSWDDTVGISSTPVEMHI